MNSTIPKTTSILNWRTAAPVHPSLNGRPDDNLPQRSELDINARPHARVLAPTVPHATRLRAVAVLLPFVHFCCATTLAQTLPTISTQPLGASRSLGDRYSFRVEAVGTPPFTYQWHHNAAALPNTTKSTLTVTNLSRASAGDYTVTVSNASGSITSDVALLEVDVAFRFVTGNAITSSGSSLGAAWADYDDDGFVDLFTNGRINNQLFHNNGDGTFARITGDNPIVRAATPVAGGGVWGDYDNNGLLDLFVADGWGGWSVLYQQVSSGRFVATPPTKVLPDGASDAYSASWGDYDRDGHLDLFAGGYWRPGTWQSAPRKPNLYHNSGKGVFTRVTDGVFADEPQSIRGSAWTDFNNDGRPDLLVARFGNPSLWLLQEQSGGFTTDEIFSIASGGFHGLAIADYDNDGDTDVFFCSQNGVNPLVQNDGANNFTGVQAGDLGEGGAGGGFGASWGDYDNDGWLDLFVARTTQWNRFDNSGDNLLYHNNGDGTFTRITSGSMVNDTDSAYTGVWADYNNDGFLDLLIANTSDRGPGAPNALFRNSGNSNAWLLFKLVGTKSNRAAIGAKVRLKTTIQGEIVTQLREISGGHGMASQNDLRAHFGLGDATQADEIRIEWPSGQVTELKNVPAKQILRITEPGGKPQLHVTRVQGVEQFSLRGDAGQKYAIEASSDLLTWSEITTLTGALEPVVFNDAGRPSDSQTFYRAVVR